MSAFLIALASMRCLAPDATGPEDDPAGTSTEIPANAVVIDPGESIQEAVDAHPEATAFLIKAGVHRLQQVSPKNGNTFVGEPGAVLSGARRLTEFIREGSYWVATGQTQAGQVHGFCDSRLTNADGSRYTGCRYPEDLFFDDVALFQVVTLAEVEPGKWYFDYAADRVYFQDDPTGRKIEISVTRHAFRPSGDNVTVRGLVIEKYANPAQHGAIQIKGNGGPETGRLGWIVTNNDIRLNHGSGVLASNGAQILDNRVHHNGQLGMAAMGDGILIQGNEIAYNHTLHFSSSWEAGGTKFVRTRDLVVRGNYVHHNNGSGLWTDANNMNVLYEDNRVTDNAKAGIFHEISYAAVVRNNVVERNGFDRQGWLYGAGILIAHSPNVEVYGNIITNNFNGIAGIQQERGAGLYGPYVLQNLWVHDNLVTMMDGLTGVATDTGDPAVFTARNNRFDRNTYCLGDNGRYFAFADGARTHTEWVEVYAQDVNGTLQC